MLPLLFLACSSISLFLVLAFFTRSSFRYLPGPTFRHYLPSGDVFPMYKDSSKMLRVIVALSKKYGEVFQLWLGPLDTVVTSVPADIAQVLSATHVFERPRAMQVMFESVVPGSLMCVSRQTHLAARKRLKDCFNFSVLQSFHGEMNHAVAELCKVLTDLEARTPPDIPSKAFNIAEHLSVTVFRVITNVGFGCHLNRDERLYFAKCTDHLVDEMMLDFVGHPFRRWLTRFGVRNRLFECRRKVNEICHNFIQTRLSETKQQQDSRPQDLLDAIIALEGSDLTSITSQTIVFAVAGAHTTTETLAWSIYETCCNPLTTNEIHKELDHLFRERSLTSSLSHDDVEALTYLRKVWKETLRKHPPGPIFARTALRDIRLSGSGVLLPKGANVVALSQGSHMDPKVWSKPEAFMPERWGPKMREGDRAPPGSYVPFSIGSKGCPGRFLADHEGLLILAELHRRFEFSLACKPDGVVSCSGWVEFARACADGANFDVGLPVYVRRRSPMQS